MGARRRRVIAVGGVGVVAALCACVWSAQIHMIDFAVYRAGARAVLDGSPVYSAHPADSLLPFTYAPFAALVLVPLSVPPVSLGQALLTGASLGALARSCVLITGQGRATWLPGRRLGVSALVLTGAALALEPVQSTLAFGQINLILMWLVVEDALNPTISSSRAAGVLTGLAAGLKLTPLIFVLYWAARRRYRAALTAVLTIAATIAVGFVVQPHSAIDYWTRLAFDPARVGGVGYVGNQSLNGVLHRLTSTPNPALWLAGSLLATSAAFVGARRHDSPLVGLGAMASAMLIASPISWSHHWVWLLPVCAGLLELGSRTGRVLVVIGGLVATAHSIWWFGDDVGGDVTAANLLVSNAYVIWASVVLLVFIVSEAPQRAQARVAFQSPCWDPATT